jgi:fumarate reductase flavoprotein subunit
MRHLCKSLLAILRQFEMPLLIACGMTSVFLEPKRACFVAETHSGQLEKQLNQMGVGDIQREYCVTWQDWMNLQNLIQVSKAITEAAISRENSRGSHYREDFPEPGSLEDSYFTAIHLDGQNLVH